MINELPRCTALLQQGIERGLHIGAQMSVSLQGRVVADFAVGLARDGKPLRTDHRMLWLSAGKPLLAVAIAQLWEQGRLTPEDLVADHIPEFAAHAKSGIQIQNLLTHTHAYEPPAVDWPRLHWDEIIAQICNARIPEGRVPGNYAAYDPQTTWYLLAEILQRITGEAFHAYVQREVLGSIRCQKASIGLPSGQYTSMLESDEIAPLHDTNHSARDQLDLRTHQVPVWAGDNELRAHARNPGGGALGPARELCAFYNMLSDLWNGVAGAGPLSPKTVRTMTERSRSGLVDRTLHGRIDWGFGFLINSNRYGSETTPYGYGKYASESTFGHSGVQSTSAYADPLQKLAVALIFNGLPGEPKHEKRNRELNTLIYEELALV
ncbi:MAG: serine hydrolase domain-containing protein [Candidatus Sumerlaeaceae bacterium]